MSVPTSPGGPGAEGVRIRSPRTNRRSFIIISIIIIILIIIIIITRPKPATAGKA